MQCFKIILVNTLIMFQLLYLLIKGVHNFPKGISPNRCPVGWGCRIHRLQVCRGVTPPANECPRYDTKQPDGEVPVMLELWGMWSTPSLQLLPSQLWPWVVAPDRAPIYEINRTNLHTYTKLNYLKQNSFYI